MTTINRTEIIPLPISSLRGNSTPTIVFPKTHYLINGVFCALGTAIILLNLALLISILKRASLRARRHYLLVAGLAGADEIYGAFYFIAGLRRTRLLATHHEADPASTWDCMIGEPYNILLFFGGQSMTLLLLLVAADRFRASFAAEAHFRQSQGQGSGSPGAKKWILLAFGYAGVSSLVAAIASASADEGGAKKKTHLAYCYSVWAVPGWYARFNLGHNLACSYAAIAVGFMAAIGSQGLMTSTTPSPPDQQQPGNPNQPKKEGQKPVDQETGGKNQEEKFNLSAYQSEQAGLTQAVLYVLGCTLLLYSIPLTLLASGESRHPGGLYGTRDLVRGARPYVAWACLLNSALRVIFYAIFDAAGLRGAILCIPASQGGGEPDVITQTPVEEIAKPAKKQGGRGR